MRVFDVRVRVSGGVAELRARVLHDTHWVWGDEPFELYYQYPVEFGGYLSETNGDPFLAALLVPAMVLGEDLHVEAAVSPQLLRHARTPLQDILCCWDGRLKRVSVDAAPRPAPPPADTPPRSALFFSMGVDSSYSLVKNVTAHGDGEDRYSHLVTVEGFDVYLWERERFVPMLRSVREVAAATGREVLAVTTNLRDLTDRTADWPRLSHGSALASTLLALGPAFARATIAASGTYDELIPWGSHPLLDPLWGTESLRFTHDGCEARRIDKIRSIARADVPRVLDNLRVCATDQVTDAYNCGRCEKCVRTMIGLHVCGALDRCGALPHVIDVEAVRGLQINSPFQRMFCRELMDGLGPAEPDVRIKEALAAALGRSAVASDG